MEKNHVSSDVTACIQAVFLLSSTSDYTAGITVTPKTASADSMMTVFFDASGKVFFSVN